MDVYGGKNGDDYHKSRHKDIIGKKDLYNAWSGFIFNSYFNGNLNGKKILEVGAGTGVNLISLINKAESVDVVEPSPMCREICKEIGVRDAYEAIGDVDDLYDFVLLRHVLEHVDNPFGMLRDIKLRLKDSGKLIVVLPVENPFSRIVKNDIDHHLFCWNMRTINNLAEKAGYECTAIKYNYYNCRKKLVFLNKYFSSKIYSFFVKMCGLIIFKPEIVVVLKIL